MTVATLSDIIRPGATRGLDFVVLDELRKRTGVNPDAALKFALREMLCNALDKDSTEVSINVQDEGDFCRLEVGDNGSKKLTLKDLKLILDFENKASSKRGFLRVQRGYLGNALKCILGYSYSLSEFKGLNPPDVTVRSANREHSITLKPDRVKEVIESKVATTNRKDDGLTRFIVRFPKDGVNRSCSILKDLIFATSMVNPQRRISYDVFGEKGTLGQAEGGKAIRHETSVLWYTQKQFESLFEDFVRARPEAQLKEFIPLFRGFTSKRHIKEILQALAFPNDDSGVNGAVQFFPTTPIRDLTKPIIFRLFQEMKAGSKPIAKRSIPAVLGCVGQGAFERVKSELGWRRLRYTLMADTRIDCPDHDVDHAIAKCDDPNHTEFPRLVELAIFDRNEDAEGLKICQCVNFMASTEDVFSRIFDISYRLGLCGVRSDTPVTVVAHLVCPVLKWLNYGKSGIDE